MQPQFATAEGPNELDAIAASVETMNDILREAGIRHFIAAVPDMHEGRAAVRLVYAGAINAWGTVIEGGMANLKGEDRVRMSRAFNKAGLMATSFKSQMDKVNGPVLSITQEPDDDPIRHRLLQRGYINPYILHIVRPDAEYLKDIASVLAAELKDRFSRPALVV